MNQGKRILQLLITALVVLVSISGLAHADTYTYSFGDYNMFNAPHSDGVAPSGTWATATFTDLSGGGVQLALSVNSSLPAGEFMDQFYFNYGGNLSLLSQSWVSNSPTVSLPTINKGSDAYLADGDGSYDILFAFQNGNQNVRFTAGEQVVYNFSSTGTLNAAQFLAYSAPGTGGSPGPYQAAAKLGGIPCTYGSDPDCQPAINSTTSAWSAAPEPVSSALFLIGGTLLAGRRLLKRKV